MSKYFLLNHEKKLAKIDEVNIKIINSNGLQFYKNDVTEPKTTLKTSKGQFQQPFSKLLTLFLNNFVWKWLLKLTFSDF